MHHSIHYLLDFHLSINHSINQSIYLSIYLSIFLSIYLPWSTTYLPFYLCIFTILYYTLQYYTLLCFALINILLFCAFFNNNSIMHLVIYHVFSLSIFLPACLPIYPSIYQSIDLSSTDLSTFFSFFPFHPSTYASVNLSFSPSFSSVFHLTINIPVHDTSLSCI